MNASVINQPATDILSLDDVHKSYGGQSVLQGVNLTLKQGSVMGLLGANGAGKTTLLKTALGLLKSDRGESKIFGQNTWDMSDSVKQKLGFVAQKFEFFDWMKVDQLIEYTSAFYSNWDLVKAKQLIADWDIDTSKKISKLSEGQKQRLAITLAISHNPELLILDEPVASLDPQARRQFIKQLIDMNIDNNTSILFSTHITSDIERVAADVAFLHQGKIQYQGGVDELKEQVVRLHIQASEQSVNNLNISGVINKKVVGDNLTLTIKGFNAELLSDVQTSLNAQIQVESLGLEDIFLELNQ